MTPQRAQLEPREKSALHFAIGWHLFHSPLAGDIIHISDLSLRCCYQVHGSESTLVASAMASTSTSQKIPTWSGDPVEFETLAIACRWYEKSVKDSERKRSASRVWARLTGPAKAVVGTSEPR